MISRKTSTLQATALLALLVTATGCKTTTGKTALGAGAGAVVGGVAGYMIAGEKGAMIGAGAGALIGGSTVYALAKKEERQRATELELKAQAVAENAPIVNPVLEVQNLTATPATVQPGAELELAIDVRAISGDTIPVTPPTVDVTLLRDSKVLRKQELTAENTGDVTLTAAFSIPKNAQPGTYIIQVRAEPQGGIHPPTRVTTFEIAPPAVTQVSGEVARVGVGG